MAGRSRPHLRRLLLGLAHASLSCRASVAWHLVIDTTPPCSRAQDRERGVVWEETIIFLEHSTKMVSWGAVAR